MTKYKTAVFYLFRSFHITHVIFVIDLKDGLLILETLKVNYGASTSAPMVVSSRAEAVASKMIKLVEDYEVYVPLTTMRTAISYGKNGKEQE